MSKDLWCLSNYMPGYQTFLVHMFDEWFERDPKTLSSNNETPISDFSRSGGGMDGRGRGLYTFFEQEAR